MAFFRIRSSVLKTTANRLYCTYRFLMCCELDVLPEVGGSNVVCNKAYFNFFANAIQGKIFLF